MKHLTNLFIGLCLLGYGTTIMGQTTIPATGGNATGAGGSSTFTVGQTVYTPLSGTMGSITQGVQQPYEISVPTATENTESITLEYKVYPNPTKGLLSLIIKSSDSDNYRFKLFDLNGTLLQDRRIEGDITEVSMDNLNPSVYFLKILKNDKDVKTFKIIKN